MIGNPYSLVEEGTAVAGLILSLILDLAISAQYLNRIPDQKGIEKLLKPVSIFMVIIITYKVVSWII